MPEETTTETETETTTTEAKPDDVEAMRAALAKANDEAKKFRLERNEAKKKADEYDKLVAESATETEKAVAAAREEGKAEALAKANDRLLRAEVTAVAAGKLADPSDAPRLLDLSEFAVDDDGDVDRAGIAKAIDALIEEKPYLASKGGRPSGDAGNGVRGAASTEPSMDDWLRDKAKGKG